jgi:tetratricopeptide (TPR) repeat protein
MNENNLKNRCSNHDDNHHHPQQQYMVDDTPQEDPDFDEAVRIQQRANRFLAAKRYKQAIEEYSAALFLVPDDPFLSPRVAFGTSACFEWISPPRECLLNYSLLAIKLRRTPEYLTLAKSCFYLKDFVGCLEAFEDCIEMLPNGETLSHFDQAYYDKAEKAMEDGEDEDDGRSVGSRSLRSIKSGGPKLPPPRFASREQVSSKILNTYLMNYGFRRCRKLTLVSLPTSTGD